jgi:hypothetical protein
VQVQIGDGWFPEHLRNGLSQTQASNDFCVHQVMPVIEGPNRNQPRLQSIRHLPGPGERLPGGFPDKDGMSGPERRFGRLMLEIHKDKRFTYFCISETDSAGVAWLGVSDNPCCPNLGQFIGGHGKQRLKRISG